MSARTVGTERRRNFRLLSVAMGVAGLAAAAFLMPVAQSAAGSRSPGVGRVPQGTQANSAYAGSNAGVTNTFVTTQQTSCYRPEVPAMDINFGPVSGYSGETPCPDGTATTGENTGASPYRTQLHSNAGYPDTGPRVVKDHSESFLAADPSHPGHLIGSSKWEVNPEAAGIHVVGFFESYDGGHTWPLQGHIPGFEGWSQVTDPIGAFDTHGNFYELSLAYQFFLNPDGSRNYSSKPSKEPNPGVPSEAVVSSEHPYRSPGEQSSTNWSATNGGDPQTARLDLLRKDGSPGTILDKPWLAIDTRRGSPHRDRIYAMWDEYHGHGVTAVAAYADARRNGTHTPWSTPKPLPTAGRFPGGASFEQPHVAANGWVYTTITGVNGDGRSKIGLDVSKDGGGTWSYVGPVATNIAPTPGVLDNTTMIDGIFYSFTIGNSRRGKSPLYVAWEDYSTGVTNILLSTSTDGGHSWSAPLQVNDNASRADEFQPTVAVQQGRPGEVSVNFYDRRLPCPGTTAAADVPGTESYNAGLRLDTANPNSPVGANPPYGIKNYCIDASVQFYRRNLSLLPSAPHNIRLTQHSWDPQLNAHRSSGNPSAPDTFIGDYFGNAIATGHDRFDFVSTFNDSTKPVGEQNPAYQQQQVVATVAVPSQ